MLTHYMITRDAAPCSLIGERVIHRRGVLVPAEEGEAFFSVEIPRGTKRPNNWARSQCQQAIDRTLRAGKRSAAWRARNHLNTPPTILRFLISHTTGADYKFRIVGMKHNTINERSDSKPAAV